MISLGGTRGGVTNVMIPGLVVRAWSQSQTRQPPSTCYKAEVTLPKTISHVRLALPPAEGRVGARGSNLTTSFAHQALYI